MLSSSSSVWQLRNGYEWGGVEVVVTIALIVVRLISNGDSIGRLSADYSWRCRTSNARLQLSSRCSK